MKIAAISDLHLDSYFYPHEQLPKDIIFKGIDFDVISIAGDISNGPSMGLEYLRQISGMYKKPVVYTLGNHDLYSYEGIEYVLDAHRNACIDGVHFLDGDTVTIDGVKFGGAMNWYDASYLEVPKGGQTKDSAINELWKAFMSDARHIIKSTGHRFTFKELEAFIDPENKIKNILDADYILTHVMPITDELAIHPKFRKALSTNFFTSDRLHLVKQSRAKYWQSGHVHNPWMKNVVKSDMDTCTLFCNPLGYRNEYVGTLPYIVEI